MSPGHRTRRRENEIAKNTKLRLSIIAALALAAPARAADRLTMSATNPTALEIDQMVARDQRVT
jgi:hypothetical protein